MKKALTCLLAIALFLCFLPFSPATDAQVVPEGFIGISDRAGLEDIRPDGSYILLNDLSLTDDVWTPLCSAEQPFCGVFDGNGYTIYGMESLEELGGLFAALNEATVKNLSLSGLVNGETAGLLAGTVRGGSIVDCSTNGTVIASVFAGGLVGQACSDASFLRVSSSATVTVSPRDQEVPAVSETYLGGIAGLLRDTVSVTDSSFTGELLGDADGLFAGGIVGAAFGNGILLERNVSAFSAELTAQGEERFGGICGWAKDGVSVLNCSCDGDFSLTGTSYASFGGICGRADAQTGLTLIAGCTFSGSLCVTNGFIGGIAGQALSETGITRIECCQSDAFLEGNGYPMAAGGIVGRQTANGSGSVRDCLFNGRVHSLSEISSAVPYSFYTGGIVGLNEGTGSGTVASCIFFGELTWKYELNNGAIVGANWAYGDGEMTICDCLCRENDTDRFATKLTAFQIGDAASYAAFDTESVWAITSNGPSLREFRPAVLNPGDVDGNGKISRYDSDLIVHWLAGRCELTEDQLLRADLNADGAVTLRDAQMMIQIYLLETLS